MTMLSVRALGKRWAAARPIGLGTRPGRSAARALAVALAVGYLALGYQWWQTHAHSAELASTAVALAAQSRTQRGTNPEAAETTTSLESRLATARAPFAYALSDDVLALLTSAAERSGLKVMTTTTGDPTPEIRDGLKFQKQPMSIRVIGTTERIVGFLDLLASDLPAARIDSVRMGGFDTVPFAQVELGVLLSPVVQPTAGTPTAQGKR